MHIVDVLRGSKAQKVINNNHQTLSTYGIGKDLSKEQWLSLSRQFVQKNLLIKDFEFGSLKVTDTGNETLSGNLKVKGKLIEEELKVSSQTKTDLEYDKQLFELLRSKRKSIADKGNVPPYVIFPDKTLIEMATYFPQSETNLRKIHGVGELKFKRYAKQFLPIIIEYCNSNKLNKKINIKRGSRVSQIKNAGTRHQEIGKMYKQCKTFDELLSKLNIKQNTVFGHLLKYVQEGNKINTGPLLEFINIDDKKKNEVVKAFEKVGVNYLKPVFDELNGTINYDELRILQICYINEKN
jgi:ATP-dependent DNA helicase RecQ